PCGGLVDAIEQGDEILAEALVRSHVEALKRRMPKPEAAILGCTHYPLLQKTFQEALGPGVRVLSQPALVAESLADYLRRRPEFLGLGRETKFLTSGNARAVSDRATQFLGHPIRFEAA
ncbi:MAG: glutamate racemase, partial [Rhodobacteraceae bacterium]|nr:glutamate racemase [Paracoccaceae bacterium]